MNKRKDDGNGRHVSSGLSLPNDMFDEIDKYMEYCRFKGSRSEFIREEIKARLDEWKKEIQMQGTIEPANKETYRSPLGTAMAMMSLDVHVAAAEVSSSKDDNNSKINDKGVRTPKTVQRIQGLEEAIRKNRERHPEIEGNNQINE